MVTFLLSWRLRRIRMFVELKEFTVKYCSTCVQVSSNLGWVGSSDVCWTFKILPWGFALHVYKGHGLSWRLGCIKMFVELERFYHEVLLCLCTSVRLAVVSLVVICSTGVPSGGRNPDPCGHAAGTVHEQRGLCQALHLSVWLLAWHAQSAGQRLQHW